MTSRDFNYWLRGYLDVLEGAPLSGDHVKKIRDTLQKVVMSDLSANPYGFGPYWATNTAHNGPDYFKQSETIYAQQVQAIGLTPDLNR